MAPTLDVPVLLLFQLFLLNLEVNGYCSLKRKWYNAQQGPFL